MALSIDEMFQTKCSRFGLLDDSDPERNIAQGYFFFPSEPWNLRSWNSSEAIMGNKGKGYIMTELRSAVGNIP